MTHAPTVTETSVSEPATVASKYDPPFRMYFAVTGRTGAFRTIGKSTPTSARLVPPLGGQTIHMAQDFGYPESVGRFLWSYHYFKVVDVRWTRDELLRSFPMGLDLFCDSGGFSAFTTGKPIQVERYADWIRSHGEMFSAIATLDAIGDHKTTMKNTEVLRKAAPAGVPVLPAFHVGSPWSALKDVLDGVDYIALGGMVPYMGDIPFLSAWLRRAFEEIPPHVRVHGFGLTGLSMWRRFPFYSVDSSSWSMAQRNGKMPIFDEARGRWDVCDPKDIKSWMRTRELVASYGVTKRSDLFCSVDEGATKRGSTAVRSSVDCEFGKYRTATISSESYRRAERWMLRRIAAKGKVTGHA